MAHTTGTSSFPHPAEALEYPNGLLCQGGELDPTTLLDAYEHGIFPWFSEGEPVMWWSPDPRFVITASSFHVSKSLRKTLRRCFANADELLKTHAGARMARDVNPPEPPFRFTVRCDTSFEAVIKACAEEREDGTWITLEMQESYSELARLGYAHSVELFEEETLVAGLYGVSVGRTFCGESMFTKVPNGSKMAFAIMAAQLFRWGYTLIDCQIEGHFLAQFGGHTISRQNFLTRLKNGLADQEVVSKLFNNKDMSANSAYTSIHRQHWHTSWLL